MLNVPRITARVIPGLFVVSVMAGACHFSGAVRPRQPYLSRLPTGLNSYLPVPLDNPLTAERVDLGRALFFDTQLSRDGTVSCASCHDPDLAFTDGRSVSVGIDGRQGRRNAPTLLNRGYVRSLFWDGRADSLEAQALLPLSDPDEMGNTHEEIVRRLRRSRSYPGRFAVAFGTETITIGRVAMALASFERTLLSGHSAFDQYRFDGDERALSTDARRGLELFRGRARCSFCHEGSLFTDHHFHNTGVSWLVSSAGPGRQDIDLGRYDVTGRNQDRGAFKTPSLRDVELTAPYMHDGRLPSLGDVIDFYNRGGEENPFLDGFMQPLNLTAREHADLIAFLESLTGTD